MDLPHLARVLDSTLSSDPQIREESSRFLLQNVLPRSDGLESLLLLSSSSSLSGGNGGSNEGEQLLSDGGKLAAAVAFKNGIKKRWIVSNLDEETTEDLEQEEDSQERCTQINGGFPLSSSKVPPFACWRPEQVSGRWCFLRHRLRKCISQEREGLS